MFVMDQRKFIVQNSFFCVVGDKLFLCEAGEGNMGKQDIHLPMGLSK